MEPETPRLAIVVDRTSLGMVVRLAGELDLSTGRGLCAQLTELLAGAGPRLVIDVDGLEHLDSSGLRVLLTLGRDAHRAGVELRVVCTSQRHVRLFRITGLSQLLHVCESEEEALLPPAATAA